MNVNRQNLGDFAIGHNLFEWIIDNIEHGSTIIELGSGTGTHELGKFYNVHCIENNEGWLNKFDNLNYHYAPIVDGWYDKDCLKDLPKDYSLLIFDGPRGRIGRMKVLENLDLFNNTACPIVVDDTHRDVERSLSDQLKEMLNTTSIEIKEDDPEFHYKSAVILNVVQ